MPDGALTPPMFDFTTMDGVVVEGGGAPASVIWRTPATSVNGEAPSGAGSKMTPVLVRYGCSVRTRAGSVDVVVTWTMSRCFWTRYSTEVTTIWSATGLT